MKSELLVIRGLAGQIIKDLSLLYPSIQPGLKRDLSRLLEADLVSGLPLYTITLPLLSKYLERCLDEEKLKNKRPPFLKAKSKFDRRPVLFYDIWCMIFEQDGTLRTDADAYAVAALRMIFMFAKKLSIDCGERHKNNAISQFREIETSLPQPWEDTWTSDSPRWYRRFGHPLWGVPAANDSGHDLFESNSLHEYDLDLDWDGFGSFAARIVSQFGFVDVFGLTPEAANDSTSVRSSDPFVLRPKHGPGAVSDKSNHTKYDQLYWTHRLESVFPYDFFGAPSSDASWLEGVIYREFPSQLHAVPKTQSGPRLIAAEPTAHQWMQGAMRLWLEDACNKTMLSNCIDFRSQEASRLLAREASRSGNFATVDLSSASDRLSCRLVEYCFQANRSLLDALHACRTRAVVISKEDPSDLVLLRKFATQGSAVTFPVQTIVYTLLAIWATALSAGGDRDFESLAQLSKQVRVFGDDIIVPTYAYPVLRRLLASVRLVVNESKSFAQGKFRESCGMDAYNGVDVTPAYFRQLYSPAPETLVSVIECSNNFYKKGYYHAADYILKTVPLAERILIPFVGLGSGTFGLVTVCGDSFDHLRKRWNADLHRWEYKVLTLDSSPDLKHGQGHGNLMQFFCEYIHSQTLVGITPYSSGQIVAPNLRKKVRWVAIDDMAERRDS